MFAKCFEEAGDMLSGVATAVVESQSGVSFWVGHVLQLIWYGG